MNNEKKILARIIIHDSYFADKEVHDQVIDISGTWNLMPLIAVIVKELSLAYPSSNIEVTTDV